MAFCAKCGAQLAEGVTFCGSCGAPVGAAPGAAPPAAASSGMASNVAGLLTYILGFITGIIFLVIDPYKNDKFVRFHAFQSIFFNVAIVVFWIVFTILSTILGIVSFGVLDCDGAGGPAHLAADPGVLDFPHVQGLQQRAVHDPLHRAIGGEASGAVTPRGRRDISRGRGAAGYLPSLAFWGHFQTQLSPHFLLTIKAWGRKLGRFACAG